jgi:DNA-directed RNA polymerase specialized sigma24 family protein
MRIKRNRFAAPLLNATDNHGRAIDPSVLSVAQKIASKALIFGEKLLGDSALAATLLEEAAASVSETMRRKMHRSEARIEDVTRYLFRAFVRRIQVEKQTQLVLDFGAEEDWEKHARATDEPGAERRVLVQEVLDTCDTVTREIVYRRLEGFSWKEIELSCGISSNAAKLRFSKTLRRLRKKFGTGGSAI